MADDTSENISGLHKEMETNRGWRRSRMILGLALPAIFSNITVPLLGLSDTAIAGHLGDPLFLASMAVGASMIHLSFWLFGFLRMGTTGLTARAFGRKDQRALSDLFCRSFFWGVAIGVALTVCSGLIGDLLLRLLEPGEHVAEQAAAYFRICVGAAPAQLATMAMAGWMVGMQSTFWPMVVALTTNILNIILSLFLVFGRGMGFEGLAMGTCLAQWLGMLLALYLSYRLWRRSREWSCPLFSGFRNLFNGFGEGNFFKVNIYLFFRSAAVMGVLLGMTAFAGRDGEMALAVNAVLLQFFYFFSYFMDGYAYAAEALTGRFSGEQANSEYRKVVRDLLLWSGAMVVIFTTVYTCFGQGIVGLLTDSGTVAEAAQGYRWVLVLLPVLSVGAFIYDGFFIGLARTGWMLTASLVAAGSFFSVNLLQVGFDWWPTGNALVWIGFLSYLAVRGIVLALVFRC